MSLSSELLTAPSTTSNHAAQTDAFPSFPPLDRPSTERVAQTRIATDRAQLSLAIADPCTSTVWIQCPCIHALQDVARSEIERGRCVFTAYGGRLDIQKTSTISLRQQQEEDIPFSSAHLSPSRYSTSRSSSLSSLLPTRTTTRCGDARARQSASHRCRFKKLCRL